jgi:heptaprenyl diphosphate synthase
MELARADARRWADDARAVLAPLPDISARRALAALCDLVVSRTS